MYRITSSAGKQTDCRENIANPTRFSGKLNMQDANSHTREVPRSKKLKHIFIPMGLGSSREYKFRQLHSGQAPGSDLNPVPRRSPRSWKWRTNFLNHTPETLDPSFHRAVGGGRLEI